MQMTASRMCLRCMEISSCYKTTLSVSAAQQSLSSCCMKLHKPQILTPHHSSLLPSCGLNDFIVYCQILRIISEHFSIAQTYFPIFFIYSPAPSLPPPSSSSLVSPPALPCLRLSPSFLVN